MGDFNRFVRYRGKLIFDENGELIDLRDLHVEWLESEGARMSSFGDSVPVYEFLEEVLLDMFKWEDVRDFAVAENS